MDARQQTLARTCLDAAETGAMTFPQIVGALIEGGFESYLIDFRRAAAVYYLASGEALDLPAPPAQAAIGAVFDVAALQAAIREAQTLAPGYSYRGFCAKAQAAGCAGYMVSFPGRRAVYVARSGATHTEHFPPD
ncbi:MAG: DUF1398 domain-containing protein [Caulobacterales bacterium 32-69-10]|nr:MAG: DUF1398 domain-containing protein [Caulobacterales bacterium 32-69-10]